jgi:O-methyltransferase
MNDLLEQVKELPTGDYAECGVWKGDMACYIHERMAPNSTLHLFDSFEGHPEPTNFDDKAHPKGRYSDTSEEAVRARLPHANVRIYKGFFPSRFSEVSDVQFRFVNVDCDLYESVKHCIEFFRPRMVPGGVIRFDDYEVQDCPGATKACREYGIHDMFAIT